MADKINSITFSELSRLSLTQIDCSRSKYLGRLKITVGLDGERKTFRGAEFIKKAKEELNNDNNREAAIGIINRLCELSNPKPTTLIARVCQAIARLFSKDPLDNLKSWPGLPSLRNPRVLPEEAPQQALANQEQEELERAQREANRRRVWAVIDSLRNGETALQDLSPEMRNNEGIVVFALGVDGLALQHASEQVRGSHYAVLHAVRSNGLALQSALNDLNDNEEIVMNAVQQNPMALQFASPRLQSTLEIVLAAVSQNPMALDFAHESLHDHPEIRAAIRNMQPLIG